MYSSVLKCHRCMLCVLSLCGSWFSFFFFLLTGIDELALVWAYEMISDDYICVECCDSVNNWIGVVTVMLMVLGLSG